MLTTTFHGAFMKDYRRVQKRGKDMSRLTEVIDLLTGGQPLQPRHKNHPLRGNYKDWWECHIEPDWLLVYRIDRSAGRIVFFRTGSHSDLF